MNIWHYGMRIEFYLLRIVSELLVLLKIIYNLIWKGERGREHAGTIGWFIPQLSEAAFGLEPRSAARNPSGSPTWMDGMNSTTQVVTCCLPRCTSAGTCNRALSWDFSQDTPVWDESMLSSDLSARPNAFPLIWWFLRMKNVPVIDTMPWAHSQTLCWSSVLQGWWFAFYQAPQAVFMLPFCKQPLRDPPLSIFDTSASLFSGNSPVTNKNQTEGLGKWRKHTTA